MRAGSASRGQHQLQFEFEPTGTPGVMQGKGSPGRCGCTWMASSSRKTSSRSPPHRLQPRGLTCGANPGLAVTTDYQAPFRFTGTLHTVTVDLSGDLTTDTEAEMRMAMARQ